MNPVSSIVFSFCEVKRSINIRKNLMTLSWHWQGLKTIFFELNRVSLRVSKGGYSVDETYRLLVKMKLTSFYEKEKRLAEPGELRFRGGRDSDET